MISSKSRFFGCLFFCLGLLCLYFEEVRADGEIEQGLSSDEAVSSQKAEDKEEYTGPKLSDFDLARYQYCGDDSDCVISLNGCCNCENGTAQVAINNDRLADFRSNFKCDKIACGKKLSSVRCSGSVVTCVEHRCRLIPADENL